MQCLKKWRLPLCFLSLLPALAASQEPSFVNVGLFGGGNVLSIGRAFEDDSHLLTVSESGGFFRSSDGGVSWGFGSKVFDEIVDATFGVTLPNEIVVAERRTIWQSLDAGVRFAISLEVDDDILSLTRARDQSVYALTTKEILISDNGGTDWRRYQPQPPFPINDLKSLKEGADAYLIAFNGNEALVQSSAAGDWQRFNPPNDGIIRPFGLDFGTDGRQLVVEDGAPLVRSGPNGTWEPLVSLETVLADNPHAGYLGDGNLNRAYLITDGGLWVTRNRGSSWTRATDNWNQLVANGNGFVPVINDFYEVGLIGRVFAPMNQGLMASVDSGRFFRLANLPLFTPTAHFSNGTQILNAGDLGTATFATGVWGWRQADVVGKTHFAGYRQFPDDQSSFYLFGSEKSGVSGGLWSTSDAGLTWLRLDGLQRNNGPLTGLVVNPNLPDRVIVASFVPKNGRSALQISNNRGTSFSNVGISKGFRLVDLENSPNFANKIFALADDGEILFSGDGGNSFSINGKPQRGLGFLSIAVDAETSETIYLGTDEGLYVSDNRGSSIAPLALDRMTVIDLATDPNRPAEIWALTDEFGLLRSSNDGNSFARFSNLSIEAKETSFFLDWPASVTFLGLADFGAFSAANPARPILDGRLKKTDNILKVTITARRSLTNGKLFTGYVDTNGNVVYAVDNGFTSTRSVFLNKLSIDQDQKVTIDLFRLPNGGSRPFVEIDEGGETVFWVY